MIEDVGRVVKITGDKALVTVERSADCVHCGLREVEGLGAGGKPVFEVMNMAGAKIGDRVKVRVEAAYIKGFALFCAPPLLLSITGGVLGAYLAKKFNMSSDTMSALLGTGGLIIGLLGLFLFRKKWARKEYMPVIVGVIRKNATP